MVTRTYFLALLLPAGRCRKVLVDFLKRHGSPVHPHITVKNPSGLNSLDVCVKRVADVAGHMQDFEVRLGEPGRFGADVVYLSVSTPEVVALHQGLVRALEVPGDASPVEGVSFVPHLTLGERRLGLSKQQLAQLFEAAVAELSELDGFVVDRLSVCKLGRSPGNYSVERELPFGRRRELMTRKVAEGPQAETFERIRRFPP